jgi:16S rRNA (adenine1518-N6/adenine1519-N6)-dimethyltransferase
MCAGNACGAARAHESQLLKHLARKRFGQNFLVDTLVLESIVKAIGVDASDTMVEIGPGLGALTNPLAAALKDIGAGPLHVVELDRDLVQRLRAPRYASALVVHEADALKFDFASLVEPPARLRVVGNLPYNISSPLLFYLLELRGLVRDQHFMLQKEVVERMTASAGDSAFGRLSVMLQVHYQMEHLFDVPPDAFDPPPRVTSAIVRMVPDRTLAEQITDFETFALLVATAFGQRRKMLRNTLSSYHQRVALEDAGITATARAEDVTPAQYVDYANRLFAARE